MYRRRPSILGVLLQAQRRGRRAAAAEEVKDDVLARRIRGKVQNTLHQFDRLDRVEDVLSVFKRYVLEQGWCPECARRLGRTTESEVSDLPRPLTRIA